MYLAVMGDLCSSGHLVASEQLYLRFGAGVFLCFMAISKQSGIYAYQYHVNAQFGI